MALVDYSDSDSSSDEEQAPRTSPKPTSKEQTDTFKKINSHKIQVRLPKSSDEGNELEGPPAKRARRGPGAFSGFSALLPPPKRSGQAATLEKLGRNLKTGAAPAFSRESSLTDSTSNTEQGKGDDGKDEDEKDARQFPYVEPEVKLVGKNTIFRPLSVARNVQKKKRQQLVTSESAGKASAIAQTASKATKSKISLFSIEKEDKDADIDPQPSILRNPDLYNVSQIKGDENPTVSTSIDEASSTTQSQTSSYANEKSIGLASLADDLNLSASAKRQLFGRNNRDLEAAAINFKNFNTDEEYKANEAMRASGELDQMQHNPVRAIAPGKHSLRQLVNAASNQRDALEEQFASNVRTKRETGSKYGW